MNDNGKKWENFRWITPITLLLISTLIGIAITNQNDIKFQLSEISSKMFIHLTNAELHIPRATIVSKDEFIIYQCMRDKQMADIKDSLAEVTKLLRNRLMNDAQRN
jgi:hypothetical protein